MEKELSLHYVPLGVITSLRSVRSYRELKANSLVYIRQ